MSAEITGLDRFAANVARHRELYDTIKNSHPSLIMPTRRARRRLGEGYSVQIRQKVKTP